MCFTFKLYDDVARYVMYVYGIHNYMFYTFLPITNSLFSRGIGVKEEIRYIE